MLDFRCTLWISWTIAVSIMGNSASNVSTTLFGHKNGGCVPIASHSFSNAAHFDVTALYPHRNLEDSYIPNSTIWPAVKEWDLLLELSKISINQRVSISYFFLSPTTHLDVFTSVLPTPCFRSFAYLAFCTTFIPLVSFLLSSSLTTTTLPDPIDPSRRSGCNGSAVGFHLLRLWHWICFVSTYTDTEMFSMWLIRRNFWNTRLFAPSRHHF